MDEGISVCLPKGNAMKPLARLLESLEFPISEYHSGNRSYRPELDIAGARSKIMAEKDVAIQVAAGNYDIGFCGLDWVREYTVKYRSAKLHLFKRLGIASKKLFACSGAGGSFRTVEDLKKKPDFVVIVSEYANLAEHFAILRRLRKFKIFSAWGSVEAYPPEHADVVLLAGEKEEEIGEKDLNILSCEMVSDICLIVNSESYVEKDLSPVLRYFP